MVSNKRQKTEEGARPTASTARPPPPPYGSRQYWEDRYRKHHSNDETTTTTTIEDSSIVVIQKDEDPPAYDDGAILFHEWYFTYEELRPLLLPIIFGGTRIDPNNITNEPIDDEQKVESDDKSVPSEKRNDSSKQSLKISLIDKKGNSVEDSDNDANDKDDISADEKNDDDAEEEEQEADEWVEVEDGQSSDGEDDSDEMVEREGLGQYGPISIIEIGCGDVPLGAVLAEELNNLQRQTSSPAGCIVKRIVCLDYSQTVISMLQEKQKEQSKKQMEDTPTLDRRHDVQLEYKTADARSLDYPDSSFQLVLEKGTLDAMLSDKETGAASSKLIVKQCARILSIGGYFVLISHLNAHAENGRQWLHELVIPGLRSGDSNASWEIEVHGEEDSGLIGKDDDEKDVDEENEQKEESDGNTSTDSPGPAVYIIRKLPPKPDGDEDLTVPLRLFSY